ncbi:hypothetical protein [Noviherbaspirillum humi]|uniref:hypothetical protein n=1 Tax=Noviherbaspirillum humi TaxID=1688639 RepID=UPI000B783A8D|nr:hypothetical protein [Noviherbaspirillum humi]
MQFMHFGHAVDRSQMGVDLVGANAVRHRVQRQPGRFAQQCLIPDDHQKRDHQAADRIDPQPIRLQA